MPRRNGRVVECTGLENRRTARYRGFESLFLRKDHTPIKPQGLMGFLMPKISGACTWKFWALKNLILLSRMRVWSLRGAPSGMPRFSRGNPEGGSAGVVFVTKSNILSRNFAQIKPPAGGRVERIVKELRIKKRFAR